MDNEYQASKYLQQVTFERLRGQPSYFFRLVPAKIVSLLVPLDWEVLPQPPGSTRSINFGYLLIIIPTLIGFVVLWRNPRRDQWLLWVLPAVVFVQAIVFYGSPRFRLPAELIAVLIAGVGVTKATRFLKNRLSLLR
jgi:hypothetical protein